MIENIVGINNFMSIGEGNIGNIGNVGSGNVGVGSTVPPDVARYQELLKAQGFAIPDASSEGSVGVGSTAPAGTTETEPDTAVDGGQSDPAPAPAPGAGNVGAGNVGIGST